MKFQEQPSERTSDGHRYSSEAIYLANEFLELSKENVNESHAVENLTNVLEEMDFVPATYNETILSVFNNPSLICRSETFSRVIDLLTHDTDIVLDNPEHQANMCRISSGKGYKVAFEEGFSGKDVGSKIKTIITFQGNNLSARDNVPPTNDLWRTKPYTASVSLIGKGSVTRDDIAMVSFLIRTHHFPNQLLSASEKSRIEEGEIDHIVRHFIPKQTQH